MTLTQQPVPQSRTYSGLIAGDGKVWLFGGAHRSYAGNDVEVYDVARNIWMQSYQPEVCVTTGDEGCGALYNTAGTREITSRGRPYAEHSYQALQYDPTLHGGGMFGVLYSGTWQYSDETKAWKRIGETPAPKMSAGSWAVLQHHPSLGWLGIFTSRLYGVYRWSGKEWTLHKELSTADGWSYTRSAYVPERGEYLIQSGSTWWRYHPERNVVSRIAAPPAAIDSFAYDTRARRLVAFHHPDAHTFRGFAYDPATNKWMAIPNRSKVPSMAGGYTSFWQQLAYDETSNLHVLVRQNGMWGGAPTETWLYRYGTSSTELLKDTAAPAAPATVSASLANGKVRLTWTPSTDDRRVKWYVVYRDGVPIAKTTRTTYVLKATGSPSARFSVVAVDTSGNTSPSSNVVTVVVPDPLDGPLPDPTNQPRAGLSFAERCSMPGVVRCFGFDSEQEVAPFVASNGAGTSRPSVDRSVRASGEGSLKMTIPKLSAADTSGYFATNFTPGSLNQVYAGGDRDKGPNYYHVQFGEGEEFYVQWRQRFTETFLTTHYAGGGGWKLMGVGEGDRERFKATACTQIEIVVNNGGHKGYPQMYHSCGGKDGRYEGLYEVVANPGKTTPVYKMQNTVVGCIFGSDSVPPCVGFVGDQWMTFQLHVKIGTWYQNDGVYHRDSLVELWMAKEGQPQQLVHRRSGYDIANTRPNEAKYGKVWLLPYNTGKDSTIAYPETYTWYDELIVSRSPIPDPE
jgi:hypothetical protein